MKPRVQLPEPETCELCGDPIEPHDSVRKIDELASEYFCLDTGTPLHESCFMDSRPPDYREAARRQERERRSFYDAWEDDDDDEGWDDDGGW